MARQVIETLIDDMDGKAADETVRFGIDGVDYSIDLSGRNAGKLRSLLAVYQEAGTRIGRSGTSTSGPRGTVGGRRAGGRDENKAIRKWAAKQGKELSDRGRIPAAIVDEYHAANK
ncbi:histone-like nucleoid-structuring protein Lsr2 [Phytohabitans houttuyneae]|uniref:Lsr2 family protein n=1 Tax=Phytohabitans houttuyneae TaxID=1076126 RepID=A0A6V8KI15_9ACTN|nr:Lsr2 family protein [Phytohabitans houttuyneae]GFJ81357.1 Lsr2 family protein [Phytohabitans houttuyneae]